MEQFENRAKTDYTGVPPAPHASPAFESESGPEPQDRIEQTRRNQAIIDLLESWRRGDEQEQRETLDYLIRVLDEDRTSYRKLFSDQC